MMLLKSLNSWNISNQVKNKVIVLFENPCDIEMHPILNQNASDFGKNWIFY